MTISLYVMPPHTATGTNFKEKSGPITAHHSIVTLFCTCVGLLKISVGKSQQVKSQVKDAMQSKSLPRNRCARLHKGGHLLFSQCEYIATQMGSQSEPLDTRLKHHLDPMRQTHRLCIQLKIFVCCRCGGAHSLQLTLKMEMPIAVSTARKD